MQLAQSLKAEGFTFIALHPGAPSHTLCAPSEACHRVLCDRCAVWSDAPRCHAGSGLPHCEFCLRGKHGDTPLGGHCYLPCVTAGLVETDLAKDLVTRVKGLVGEETAALSYYVSARRFRYVPARLTAQESRALCKHGPLHWLMMSLNLGVCTCCEAGAAFHRLDGSNGQYCSSGPCCWSGCRMHLHER